jgi:putative membrane protein
VSDSSVEPRPSASGGGGSTLASPPPSPLASPGVLLSSNNTALSFERTRMSADRTLFSIERTSLSLIGFGFTIFQFFRRLREMGEAAAAAVPTQAPRNFGLALVFLGVGLLAVGIWNQIAFMTDLRRRRAELVGEGLLRGRRHIPISLATVGAVLLLLIGLTAIFSMTIRAGPFR